MDTNLLGCFKCTKSLRIPKILIKRGKPTSITTQRGIGDIFQKLFMQILFAIPPQISLTNIFFSNSNDVIRSFATLIFQNFPPSSRLIFYSSDRLSDWPLAEIDSGARWTSKKRREWLTTTLKPVSPVGFANTIFWRSDRSLSEVNFRTSTKPNCTLRLVVWDFPTTDDRLDLWPNSGKHLHDQFPLWDREGRRCYHLFQHHNGCWLAAFYEDFGNSQWFSAVAAVQNCVPSV